MAEEKGPSLAERIKALAAKASAAGTTGGAAPASGDAAKAGEAGRPALPAASGAVASGAAPRPSISARIAALTGKAPAAPGTAPAAPPAPAAKPAIPATTTPAPAATAGADAAKLSLSERLKALAAGKVPTAGGVAPAAASAAPAAAEKPAVTAAKAPAPPAPPPVRGPLTPAPAHAPAAAAKPVAPPAPERPAAAKPAAKKAAPRPAPAPPPAPAKPEPPPWPDLPPNKFSPYVDDALFVLLPKDVQRIILEAGNEEGVVPVRRFLRKLEPPERAAQEELVVGFMESLVSTMKTRFFIDDDEPEQKIVVEPSGDLSLRTGDGDVKVRAKCWEFFILWRQRRALGKDAKERRAALLRRFEECFAFELADTSVCRMRAREPLDFEPGMDACYLEASLERGGWCELRFQSATAFTDGRVLVATFEPRVVRAQDVPPPKVMSPKEFTDLLAKKRRR